MNEEERTDAFRGMAHPLRRQVIRRLAKGERSVSQLLDDFGGTPQSMSRHLAVLRETGLVAFRAAGTERLYRLHAPAFKRVRQWLNAVAR